MADLPSVAQRINDIQVAANAPVTETTIRTIGSDINLLLDRLGIANGETGAGISVLDNLLAAISLMTGHQTDLITTIPANLTGPTLGGAVATFTMTPYVDQVLYLKYISSNPSLNQNTTLTDNLFGYSEPAPGGSTSGSLQFDLDQDAAGFSRLNGRNSFQNTGYTDIYFGTRRYSRLTAKIISSGIAASGDSGLVEGLVLDYRDGTSLNLQYLHSVFTQAVQVWRGYRLNVQSLIAPGV